MSARQTSLTDMIKDGMRYLVSIDTPDAIVGTTTGDHRALATGEFVLKTHGEAGTKVGLEVEGLSLVLAPVPIEGGSTGPISVTADLGTGSVEITDTIGSVEVVATCQISSEAMDRVHGRGVEGRDYTEPVWDPAFAKIAGTMVAVAGTLELSRLRLTVVPESSLRSEIVRVVVEIDRAPVVQLPSVPGSDGASFLEEIQDAETTAEANTCDASLVRSRRRLTIQPVGFRDSATDSNPSGSTAGAQLARAHQIWGKACIDIQMNPIHYITNKDLKTSNDTWKVASSYNHGSLNVIEVFFVQNSLPGVGGGVCYSLGSAASKVVLGEPNSGNPVLAAHELGHTLNLTHPGPGSNSDDHTVMVPTGSAMVAGTDTVTHFMCGNVKNPALQTLSTTCCLSHDIGDHYLRDFPVDVGKEPSDPLPAGMTRYSMSNVWNRLSSFAGPLGAATGPAHQEPVRWNSDGTPRTNYLFVRVEQLANLKVRDAKVRFYLKHPGSGGGGSHVKLLGEATVPNALGLAIPQNVSLAWTVPPGTPQHSCVFAVVHSPAEPEGNVSNLNWAQFESLGRTDNDWAQRNLQVVNTSSNANVQQVEFDVWSAPFVIRLPISEGQEPLPVVLQVDATPAAGLHTLALEIPGLRWIPLTPGAKQTVNPDLLVEPGKDFVMVLQATLPKGAGVGHEFRIRIDPVVGETEMVGYEACFATSIAREVVQNCLDISLSAFADLAYVSELPMLHGTAQRFKELLAEEITSVELLASGLSLSAVQIQQSLAELIETQQNLAEVYGVRSALGRFIEEARTFTNDRHTAVRVVEALRNLSQRLLVVASVLMQDAFQQLSG